MTAILEGFQILAEHKEPTFLVSFTDYLLNLTKEGLIAVRPLLLCLYDLHGMCLYRLEAFEQYSLIVQSQYLLHLPGNASLLDALRSLAPLVDAPAPDGLQLPRRRLPLL